MKEIYNKIKFFPWPHFTIMGNIALALIGTCVYSHLWKAYIFGSLTFRYLGAVAFPVIGLAVNAVLTIGFLVS